VLSAGGAEVRRSTLDDLDNLHSAAVASDGVIHLAFKHDIAFSGDFQGAADADRRAIETIGEALEGSDRPFVIASGVFGLAEGRAGTELDMPDPNSLAHAAPRIAGAQAALSSATARPAARAVAPSAA
jgi:hypothetical protein